MKHLLFIVCVFLLGVLVDRIYFSIFATSGGAMLYLAIVIVKCTHVLSEKLSFYLGNKKKRDSVFKLLSGRLSNEVRFGREKDEN